MRNFSIFFVLLLSCLHTWGDEKTSVIRTLQTRGLDLTESEYRLSSEVYSKDKEGFIWIEAESSYLLSYYPNGNTIKDDKLSGKTGIVDVMSANYQVLLDPATKSYDIYVRILYLKKGESTLNSFVDGNALNAKSYRVSITDKDVGKAVWVKINTVSSQEVYRKISLASKGHFLAIDKLVVQPVGKVNSRIATEGGVGGEAVRIDAPEGEWLSEKFSPAGVKAWKKVIIASRNSEDRFFKVYFRTRSKDWTVLNKDRSIGLDSDYKTGDFIQFRIKFLRNNKDTPIFSKLELVYEENLSVLKTISNTTSDIQVSFINGKFYSLINKASGKSFIPQDRGIMPFLFYTQNDEGELEEIDENDFYPTKPEIIDAKNGKVILKIQYKGEKTGLKIELRITVDSNSDLIQSELISKSKGNVSIVGVDFPRLQNLKLSSSWEKDQVVFPLAGGIKVEAPAAGAFLDYNYPEQCSMPWMDMVGDNGGIFFLYPDYTDAKSSFNLKVMHNTNMDGVNLALYHSIKDISKVQINAIQSIHGSSWFSGAEKFKQFNDAKKKTAETIDVSNYAVIVSPLEDVITSFTAEQMAFLEFLNTDFYSTGLASNQLVSARKILQPKLTRIEDITDVLTSKVADEVFMIENFGDNPEVFSYCFPQIKMMSKFVEPMSIANIEAYYKRNWVYHRIIPVFGYTGREVVLLQNRVKPFINTYSTNVVFNDSLNVENYQNEELMLKRYDYNDGDKRIVCLLYAHDGKAKKITIPLSEVKINNIYLTSKSVDFREIPFQYIDNKIQLEIPASENFGALLLSAGGNGKDMIYGQLSQDFTAKKVTQANLTLVNFASTQARIKLSVKIKSSEEIKFNIPEIIELKSGEAKTIPVSLTAPQQLTTLCALEISGNNLSNGQIVTLTTTLMPTVLNSDFSNYKGKNAEFWSGYANFDDYTGNNKKGSLIFQGPAIPIRSVMFVKPDATYTLNYSFNVAEKERNVDFNIYTLASVGGKNEWKKTTLHGKKSKEFDFWQQDALEFQTPKELQACYLEIVSPSSGGKIWIDDIAVVEK